MGFENWKFSVFASASTQIEKFFLKQLQQAVLKKKKNLNGTEKWETFLGRGREKWGEGRYENFKKLCNNDMRGRQ